MICRLLMLPLAALLMSAGARSLADDSKPKVSLVLTNASAEQRTHDTLFRCEVLLDNATGRELTVRSNFYSVFDGLELVVTNKEGKTLAQQPYISHQSPYTPPERAFPLIKGSTGGKLVFPISGLPADAKAFKVRLVGTLPGSGYKRILSTETIEVNVKPRD